MDVLKLVSAYSLVKDLRISDEDKKLQTILELTGFDDDSSNMLIAAARSVAPNPDMKVTEFVEMKGFGSALNLLLKQSGNPEVAKFGDYLMLADMPTDADEATYIRNFGAIGVDPETAKTARTVVTENAGAKQSMVTFMKSPAFGRMLTALKHGMVKLPEHAGVISCPHCAGPIKVM